MLPLWASPPIFYYWNIGIAPQGFNYTYYWTGVVEDAPAGIM